MEILVSPFSRGVIFTRARVSLALLSLRKNGGLLVVYRNSAKDVLVRWRREECKYGQRCVIYSLFFWEVTTMDTSYW